MEVQQDTSLWDISRYYGSARDDLLPLVPVSARRILDVGCGAGRLGEALKRQRAVTVVGIELQPDAAARAAAVLDQVICCSAEAVDLQTLTLPFDCIIMGDVLEHLVDPWAALRKFSDLLAPQGVVVASLPNVGYWSIIWGLLRGRWEYQERGVLDRSHLRFFTFRSIEELFASAGLVIERCEGNYRLRERDRRGSRLAQRIAKGPLRRFLTFQFKIVARRKGASV